MSILESQLVGINTEIATLETQLNDVTLTEEEIATINEQISALETQREDVIGQVEVQESNIASAETDLNQATTDLATAETELANTIAELETQTGVTGWADVDLDTNGDGEITEADIVQ